MNQLNNTIKTVLSGDKKSNLSHQTTSWFCTTLNNNLGGSAQKNSEQSGAYKQIGVLQEEIESLQKTIDAKDVLIDKMRKDYTRDR